MAQHRITMLVVFFIVKSSFIFGSQSDELVRRVGLWTDARDVLGKERGSNPWLYKVIDKCEQREDWYTKIPAVAEIKCTLTSLPIVYVAAKYVLEKPVGASGLMFAGLASAASHAIPRDWLHKVDHLAAFTSIAAMGYDLNLLNIASLVQVAHNPVLAVSAIATGSLYLADVAVAHTEKLKPYRRKYQTLLHCSWHLSVALLAYILFLYSGQ